MDRMNDLCICGAYHIDPDTHKILGVMCKPTWSPRVVLLQPVIDRVSDLIKQRKEDYDAYNERWTPDYYNPPDDDKWPT